MIASILLFLPASKPFGRTGGRITKSLSRSHDMINPCLQSSRNCEVAHRSCNNDFIGCKDFRHHFIREGKCSLMVFIEVFGGEKAPAIQSKSTNVSGVLAKSRSIMRPSGLLAFQASTAALPSWREIE